MSTEMPFRKINELVKALAAAEQGMSAGTLSLEGLETACTDARELFERLVVLRHKARETRMGPTAEPPVKVPAQKTEAPIAKAEAPEPLRLDTRPMEVSPFPNPLRRPPPPRSRCTAWMAVSSLWWPCWSGRPGRGMSPRPSRRCYCVD